jgi:CBS domain-containing protein
VSSDFDTLLAKVKIDELPRRQVSIVDPSILLGEVYRLLDEEHGVAVLVCEGRKLLGIFTERDVLYRTALEGDPGTPIGELMTADLVTLQHDDKLASAIGTMTEKGIRHIPVLGDEGEECGLIGGRDVLKLIAEYFPETLLNLPPDLSQKMTRAEGG